MGIELMLARMLEAEVAALTIEAQGLEVGYQLVAHDVSADPMVTGYFAAEYTHLMKEQAQEVGQE